MHEILDEIIIFGSVLIKRRAVEGNFVDEIVV